MTVNQMNGLPAFLRTLSSMAPPMDVLSALVFGPLRGHGFRAGRIWTLDGGDLVSIASSGHTSEEEERYAILPADLDLVLWEAVRDRRSVVTDLSVQSSSTTFDAVDSVFWSGMLRRMDAVATVRAPIKVGDRAVGALGMIMGKPWSDEADGIVDLTCSALGLWLDNPGSGAAQAVASTRARSGTHLAFTDRQREVLRLVAAGQSTAHIAAGLVVSESTVKADLAAAMRALGTKRRDVAAERAQELGLL